MEILALGSGQEIGRSCIIVKIDTKTIMLDCGIHIGYTDIRKFPDFSYLTSQGDINKILDCVLITHFHLDHCGALPYLTEILGYRGPVYMTHPTKAMIPMLLQDCLKIILQRSDRTENHLADGTYGYNDIENCVKKITPISMNETVEISPGFKIRPYYAGHVIGASMYYITCGEKSLVYTGDFNSIPDRHLDCAKIDMVRPDIFITESTYGNVVKEPVKSKEYKFLCHIEKTLKNKGVALIPSYALGRSQEMCLLLEEYWDRMGFRYPIYVAGLLNEQANSIYKQFIHYTKLNVTNGLEPKNPFNFRYIKPYVSGVELKGPSVIFSTPVTLHNGITFKIFKNICSDCRNLLILSGYSVKGTLADKVISGEKEIFYAGAKLQINISVSTLSFSGHSDTLGILKLIRQCRPYSVFLVHGDKSRMISLKKTIENIFSIPVYYNKNGIIMPLDTTRTVSLTMHRNNCKGIIPVVEGQKEINILSEIAPGVNSKLEIVRYTDFFIMDSETH